MSGVAVYSPNLKLTSTKRHRDDKTNTHLPVSSSKCTHTIYIGRIAMLSVIHFSKQINLSSAFTSILVSLNASQVGTITARHTFTPTAASGSNRNNIN